MVIDSALLDYISDRAKGNPRLRQNYDLRNSAEDKSQRMLNALEPDTMMPIHRHRYSSETVVLLKGSIRQNFYSIEYEGAKQISVLTDSWLLEAGGECVGCNIPAGQWHNLDCLESGTIIFEAKDGAWASLEECDVLNASN
jgi:cupin fold WbuC family metalloprotein